MQGGSIARKSIIWMMSKEELLQEEDEVAMLNMSIDPVSV